jgi:hypothetical protein
LGPRRNHRLAGRSRRLQLVLKTSPVHCKSVRTIRVGTKRVESSSIGISCQVSLPTLLPVFSQITCGICVTRSPQWFWVVESLGFRVAWVWSSSLDQLPSWLNEVCPSANFTTVSLHLPAADLVLCNSSPPTWVQSSPLAHPLVATTGGRFSKQKTGSWKRYVTVNHSELGGLTDVTVSINIQSTTRCPSLQVQLPSLLPTTVYSVAEDTLDVGKTAARPHQQILTPPRVQLLGHDTYHGGGLYPVSAVAPRFLLPSVKHAPTWWCIQRLLTTEEWQIYNVPWRVFRLVSTLSNERLLFRRLLPGRSMEHGLCYLLRGMGLMTEGGVLDFPNTEQLKEALERKKGFEEAGKEAGQEELDRSKELEKSKELDLSTGKRRFEEEG